MQGEHIYCLIVLAVRDDDFIEEPAFTGTRHVMSHDDVGEFAQIHRFNGVLTSEGINLKCTETLQMFNGQILLMFNDLSAG